MLKGEPARLMKNSLREVATTHIVETGTESFMINNIGTQPGDPEEDDNGVGICTSTSNSKSLATSADEKLAGAPSVMSKPGSGASPVLPSYPVGRGISLSFGQLLPKCDFCSFSALIAWSGGFDPKQNGFMCLNHGLQENSATRDLVLKQNPPFRYCYISPAHEAAIQAFLNTIPGLYYY